MRQKVFFAFLSFAFVGCNYQTVNLNTERENIITAWQDWPKKTAEGKPDFYWAEDAIVMSQGQPVVEGKNNINEMMKNVFKMPGFKMNWDPKPGRIYICPSGDMAYLTAGNQLFMTDSTGKTIVINNTCFQVWKKDSANNWKAVAAVMYPETSPMKAK